MNKKLTELAITTASLSPELISYLEQVSAETQANTKRLEILIQELEIELETRRSLGEDI